ncbi:MAG: hypothetical protein ACRD1L_06180 [Terriglobales bacterium]
MGLLIAVAMASPADSVVSWRQIVGIIPAGNVVGSGTGKVTGGFLPWTTTSGRAEVNLATGELHFHVRGLVFAGGAHGVTIGTPGPVTAVRGTLVCDTNGDQNGGNSVLVSTAAVPLSATGDAEFSGNVGPLPDACNAPDIAFLVQVTNFGPNGPWIASGQVQTRGDGAADNR